MTFLQFLESQIQSGRLDSLEQLVELGHCALPGDCISDVTGGVKQKPEDDAYNEELIKREREPIAIGKELKSCPGNG